MTVITSSVGESRDVELDINKVIAYEQNHPDWSILAMAGGMDNMRFSEYDLMCKFMGFEGFEDLVSQGFSPADVGEVLKRSKFLGFTEQD